MRLRPRFLEDSKANLRDSSAGVQFIASHRTMTCGCVFHAFQPLKPFVQLRGCTIVKLKAAAAAILKSLLALNSAVVLVDVMVHD